jgi:hypothetical protein
MHTKTRGEGGRKLLLVSTSTSCMHTHIDVYTRGKKGRVSTYPLSPPRPKKKAQPAKPHTTLNVLYTLAVQPFSYACVRARTYPILRRTGTYKDEMKTKVHKNLVGIRMLEQQQHTLCCKHGAFLYDDDDDEKEPCPHTTRKPLVVVVS